MLDHVHMLLECAAKDRGVERGGLPKRRARDPYRKAIYEARVGNYAGQVFWARGFFVYVMGRDTETIRRYIANQQKEDQMLDQLEMA